MSLRRTMICVSKGVQALSGGLREFVARSFSVAGSRRRSRCRSMSGVEALEIRQLLTTFTVLNLNDDGVGSLRDALDQANNNANPEIADTIVFDSTLAGKITLSTGELVISESVTINGDANLDGMTDIVIDANDSSRVFNISNGNFVNQIVAELSFLTITGGNADLGGGISNTGELTINDSSITENAASDSGGGLYNIGTLRLNNSTVVSNSAVRGGGFANDGISTVTDSTLSGNMATSNGGGILNNNVITIVRSTIFGNSGNNGGGVYSSSTAELISSTISGNSANSGGGLYSLETLDVRSSTVANNTSTGNGSGLLNLATASIDNTIFAMNSPGGDITNIGELFGTSNLVQDGSGLDQFNSSISGDPHLGPLQDNGGPTLTHALPAGSPAVDAGDTARAMGQRLTTDQRGEERFVGDVDMGAFELGDQEPPTIAVEDSPSVVTSTNPFTITIVFSEDVTGFELSDIVTTNGTAANFATIDDRTYTVEITPDGSGDMTIELPADIAVDAAGNGNMASTTVVQLDLTVNPLGEIATSPIEDTSINGDFERVLSGDFDGSSMLSNRADDLFFWNPTTGENRIALGDGTVLDGPIDPTLINGSDLFEAIVADLDGGDGQDLFLWNPMTGQSRLIHLRSDAMTGVSVANVEDNVVAPTEINGGDFDQVVAGDFDGAGPDDLFFWNPANGRNRLIHIDSTTAGMSTSASNIETNVVPVTAINGNDFATVEVGQFVVDGLAELLFFDLLSGKNRRVEFTATTVGVDTDVFEVLDSPIEDANIGGTNFTQWTVGDFNNDGRTDLFVWNSVSGENRLLVTAELPMDPAVANESPIAPVQINGDDFQFLVTLSVEVNNGGHADGVFFWDPLTGKNRLSFGSI